MTDPERILDRPPSPLAAELLRAGAEELPSQRSLQRTLSAIGVGAAALGTAGSAGAFGVAKVATQATLVTLVKWAGLGAVGGMVVAAAAHDYRSPPSQSHAEPPGSAVHAPLRPAAALPVAPAAPPATEALAAASEPAAAPAPPRPARPAAVADDTEAPLAAEVAFVDRGRAAFQRGELEAALSALAPYERRFPEARLLPEVLYLRMETRSRRGEPERALELGRRILRDYPRSPHAARARELLGAR